MEKQLGNIAIEYSGVYAQQMAWQTATLHQFREKSHLLTDIVIRQHALKKDQPVVSSLGDTLAWRRQGDFTELFSRSKSKQTHVQVETNHVKGQALVAIDDQALVQEKLATSKGRITENDFIAAVNTLVKKGVTEVLYQEKMRQMSFSLLSDISHGIYYGIPLGVILFELKGICDLGLGDDMHNLALGEVYSTIPLMSVYSCLIAPNMHKINARLGLNNPLHDKYKDRGNTHNPFKHLLNAQAGDIYLRTKGKQLVKSNQSL